MVDMPSRRLVKSPTAKSNRRSLSNLLGALTIVVVGDFTVGDLATRRKQWPVGHHWPAAETNQSATAVLTNGHTGHVPRAPDFFLFEGPQLAVVK